MNMPKTNLPSISDIKASFPQFNFSEHEVFHWSPQNQTVFYNQIDILERSGIYQLLHEIGHALCSHTNYTSGVTLLKMETQAWTKAQEIAKDYNLKIDPERIERCLDSYRDWLHLRSACPQCQSVSIETSNNQYHCFNCMQKWKVPTDQRSRHYRLKFASHSR